MDETKDINIYVYFDKLYIGITMFFLIIGLFLIPSQYAMYVFVLFIFTIGLVYLYKNNYFATTVDKPKKDKSPSTPKDEVFHISNNIFDYKTANLACKAYGSRLANYKDLEKAYQSGADCVLTDGLKIIMCFFQHSNLHMIK